MTDCKVRLGISMPLGSAADTVEMTRFAQSQGCEEAWLAEVNGGDAYALAGALAQGVPGMRLGTAVTPAQTRTPFVHAMAATTLAQLTNNNFVLGMGLSSPNIVRDWAGQPFDRPLGRMEDHVQAIRGLLSGNKTNYEGKTLSVSKAKLAGPVPENIPIYLGALNQKMLRLTGRLCDGIILNMVPEHGLKQVLSEVRKGAEEAGKDPSQLQVVSRLHVVVTDDTPGAQSFIRSIFGPYAATPGYNRFFSWIGFEDEAKQIADSYANKDRAGVAAGVSDGLCDAIAVVGNRDQVRARLAAYAEQGVDVCVINPIGDPNQVRDMLKSLQGCLDGITVKHNGVLRGTGG